MQTSFVSKSPLIVGLFLLLAAAISSLGSILLVNISISVLIGLVLFAMGCTILSALFLHMYIKEMFRYYIEVSLLNILQPNFKSLTDIIESNHSYVKRSFDRIFKDLGVINISIKESGNNIVDMYRGIHLKLDEIGLDISERKKSVEIINKKREEAINTSKEDLKEIFKNIGEMMNENSKDIKDALQDLEFQQPTKEDLSETNLKEDKEPKLVDEVKASDLELSE